MQTQTRLAEILNEAGLRPTRQRLGLAALLFDGTHKHVTAEQVYGDCVKHGARISLATVYNSLNHFTAAGLLHQVVIDGGQVFFDTNTGDHHHIFDENSGGLTDIPAAAVQVSGLPELPEGKALKRIDVVFRVRTAG